MGESDTLGPADPGMPCAQRQRLGLGDKLAVGAKEALLEKALLPVT